MKVPGATSIEAYYMYMQIMWLYVMQMIVYVFSINTSEYYFHIFHFLKILLLLSKADQNVSVHCFLYRSTHSA